MMKVRYLDFEGTLIQEFSSMGDFFVFISGRPEVGETRKYVRTEEGYDIWRPQR